MMPWHTDEDGVTWGRKGQGKISPASTPLDFTEDFSLQAECDVMEANFFEVGVIHERGFVQVSQGRDGWFNVAIEN